jgi:acyl-CoA synthetase (AMP-forming)/AMP-acid ligase II
MTDAADQAPPIGFLPDYLRELGRTLPDQVALIHRDQTLTYAELDVLMDRVAAACQRDGLKSGQAVAICALSSIPYVAVYMGALRAGLAAAPLAPSSTADALVGMLEDCAAPLFFLDKGVAEQLSGVADRITARRIALDGSDAGEPFEAWLGPEGARPEPVEIDPGQAFNIIYSSGTTGAPKGIVQSHRMRFSHLGKYEGSTYEPNTVTMVSTPLYSNTTLVSILPTLANGGTAVLIEKFDVSRFLEEAQKHRATHAMLVPVQYRRIMEHPEFDSYDLSSFRMKYCTSAPFSAALKADVLKRWPGGLIEYYGMTEGGGGTALLAHEFPDKLHTVGRPGPGVDVRLIDEEGRQVPPGEVGEVVGRSGAMMNGYHNKPDKTSEAQWVSPEGLVFIRNGDVGRFDEDGFLILMDRKKDMIITGGFNIYPSDLEHVLLQHPAVADAAVVGVASDRWGETPIAFVVVRESEAVSADEVKRWANERLGKTQRLADIVLVDSLPRSHIGKILKRELRDGYKAPEGVQL